MREVAGVLEQKRADVDALLHQTRVQVLGMLDQAHSRLRELTAV